MLEKHELEKRNRHTGDNKSSGETAEENDRVAPACCVVVDDLPTINTYGSEATQNR